MLEELLRHALRVNAARHEIVAPVAQHADKLGGQRIVQQLEHNVAVRRIPCGDRPFGDVLAGALAQCLDVSEKRFVGHECASVRSNGDRAPGLEGYTLPIKSRTRTTTTTSPSPPLGP